MISAVILAAGLASRMGMCKPLLPLGGQPMIRVTAERLLEGGADAVIVVTGNRSKAVQDALQGLPVHFVHNEAYAETEMFASVCMGLRAAEESDSILITPADVPMFSPKLVGCLLEKMRNEGAQAVWPRVHGKNGHPLLLRADAVAAVLQYRGENGLKGALSQLHTAWCDTQDEGCLLDVDTVQEYGKIVAYRQNCPPTEAEIRMLHDRFGSTPQIKAHCKAVENKCMELMRRMPDDRLDRTLLSAAARLHDAARTRPHHAAVLAQALLEMGYGKTAEIVSTHMQLLPAQIGTLSEATVLYLADKLVQDTVPVTLEERFSNAARKYAGNAAACKAAAARYQAAKSILDKIDEVS